MARLLRGLPRLPVVLIVLALAAVWVQYDVSIARMLIDDLHLNDFGKFNYSATAFGPFSGSSGSTFWPVDDSARLS